MAGIPQLQFIIHAAMLIFVSSFIIPNGICVALCFLQFENQIQDFPVLICVWIFYPCLHTVNGTVMVHYV